MSAFHDFRERLEFSEGIEITEGILRHIFNSIPAAERIVKAEKVEDLNGTDYWVHRRHGLPAISIDLKNREFCPIDRWKSDDACIETCSVYLGSSEKPYLDRLRSKPGWTIDDHKRTDLLVYTWPHAADLFGTAQLRFWILYFPFLCQTSIALHRQWVDKYGERSAWNKDYLTLSVYPPRPVIAQAIRELTTNVTVAGAGF